MKLFLDTADKEAIKKYAHLLDGVTTNPSNLAYLKGNPKEDVCAIAALMNGKDVSVEVTEKEPDAVYKQAKALAALADNIVVKIPCQPEYYGVIEKLVHEGIRLNITLVFTLIQAYYMCKMRVDYISPFVGRWDDVDVDGKELLFEIREMIDIYNYQTQLLAASIRGVRHLHEALMAGADAATIPVEVLEKSIRHPLTEQGIKKFDADWKKLNITQFP